MQWVANSQIAVIGHGREEEIFCAAQGENEVHLQDAATKGDGSAFPQENRNGLGNAGCGVSYLQQGEVAKEEVHGGAELMAGPH